MQIIKNSKIILFLLIFCVGTLYSQQSLQWAKVLSGKSGGSSIITDATGNIYTCGGFGGTVDFDPGPGIFTVTAVGASDIFVTKFDSNGTLLWVKTMGGAGSSASSQSIKLDPSNNIILCGYFGATVDFDPGPGILNLTSAGARDIYIVKLDPNANFLWARSCGSTLNDLPNSLTVDIGGNAYITGYFTNTVDFNPGAGVYNLTSNGQLDIFILKLNSLGNFVWARGLGGIYDDSGMAIHMDVSGNIWTTGYFVDVVDFDPGTSVYNLSNSPNYGTYILELDAAGNFLNARALTTSNGYVTSYGITTDASGNVYSAGFFAGTADFDPNGGVYNLNAAGGNDAYISKLDPFGNFLWAKALGGTSIDIARALDLDQDNNVYITGNFQGTADFDPGAGTFTLSSNGGDDAYVAKLDVNGNFLCAGAFGGSGGESGASVRIDGSGNILNTGSYQSLTDFDPGTGVYNMTPTGTNEAFILKFTQFLTGTPISNTLCAGGSLTLTGLGANTYSWSPSTGLNSTTGNTVITTPSSSITYTVIGKTGCVTTNTIIAINVLAKPNLSPPVSPQKLNCIPDSLLLQSSSSNSNTTLQWRFITSNNYTVQPFYAKIPGNYFSRVTDNTNGCSDSSAVTVLNNKIPPNAKLSSHVYNSPLIPVDTVTCYQPTVTLAGSSDTAGVAIIWKSISNNFIFSNPANITTLDNLKLIVTRNDNNCSDSSLIVLVNQNNTPPSVLTNTANTQLNCSIYSAALNAAYSPPNCSVYWLSPTNFTVTNPGVTGTSGQYKIYVTDPGNGCTKTDSVMIVQTNQLLLNVTPDTMICKNTSANLNASAVGTITGITYNWNTGQNSPGVTVITATTTNYIVTASDNSGCLGTDTIKVIVPADIQDSVIAYRSCSNNNSGTIVVFAQGGIAPYQYSINNGSNFSGINSFTNIPFGDYSITIKDSLGCTTQTNVTLSAESDLPVPKFLASTLNFQSDTIVLVDISIPKADSVNWILPVQASIVGGDMFNPVIVYSDTGAFIVTMQAHYGNCVINVTKLIRFIEPDTLLVSVSTNKGIKSLVLYPNPNNGQFNAAIEFYKKQNMCIQVWDSGPVKIQQQNYYDVEIINVPFNLPQLQNGNYFLRVIGEYDSRNFYFIINK